MVTRHTKKSNAYKLFLLNWKNYQKLQKVVKIDVNQI